MIVQVDKQSIISMAVDFLCEWRVCSLLLVDNRSLLITVLAELGCAHGERDKEKN